MALGSSWWSFGGWAGLEWEPAFDTTDSINNILSLSWCRYDFCGAVRLAGLASSYTDSPSTSKNFSYFYGTKDSAPTVIKHMGYVRAASILARDPDIDGMLQKKVPSGNDMEYKTLWHEYEQSDTETLAAGVYWLLGGSDTYSIYYYQPFCAEGNPAELIPAVLLFKVLDTTIFDQTSFSDSHTAQTAMSTEPMCYFRRDVGEKLADSIKRVSRHCYDILCVNMAGKIALVSRDDPPAGPTSLSPSDCIGEVLWRYGYEYLCNFAEVSHGQWCYAQEAGDSDTPDNWGAIGLVELNCESDVYGYMTTTYEDTTSQGKYGKRVLDNASAQVMENGALTTRPKYHLPYFYDEDCKDVIMGRITNGIDGTLRRELHVAQDLRGLDYDIGYIVEDVAVTSDGDTIADTRCIRKRIDFNNMTVESWLLEEPAAS